MSSSWTDFVDLPQSTAGTPLRFRQTALDNSHSQDQAADRKRGPSTPLTPSLVQKNILKRQALEYSSKALVDKVGSIEEFKPPSQAPVIAEDERGPTMNFESHYSQENSIFAEGSPKSRRSSTGPLQPVSSHVQNLTPRITNGIKQAVKDHKKSRLHMLKMTAKEESAGNDSVYSEASTISGDTPNYKFKENLVYYKNGYYMDNVEDSFTELERSQIVDEKELARMNSLLEFVNMERQFELEQTDH